MDGYSQVPLSPELTSWSFFRPDQVSVLDTYYYDDGCEPCGNDTFSREPTIVRFFSPYTGECCCAPLSALPRPR